MYDKVLKDCNLKNTHHLSNSCIEHLDVATFLQDKWEKIITKETALTSVKVDYFFQSIIVIVKLSLSYYYKNNSAFHQKDAPCLLLKYLCWWLTWQDNSNTLQYIYIYIYICESLFVCLSVCLSVCLFVFYRLEDG